MRKRGDVHLTLIRHPPVRNPLRLCYGRLDLPLKDGWPECVSRWPMQGQIYSSPSWRCYVAARWVTSAENRPKRDDRLLEIDFGRWEGVPWDEVSRAELDAWADNPTSYRPGGGESASMMARRVTNFFDELTRKGEDAVVVTHGGPLKVLCALCRGDAWKATDRPISTGEAVRFDLETRT